MFKVFFTTILSITLFNFTANASGTVVDDHYNEGYYTSVMDYFMTPSGDHYTVGALSKERVPFPDGGGDLVVRKSTDGGKTWQMVDKYRYAQDTQEWFYGTGGALGAITANGTLVVIGNVLIHQKVLRDGKTVYQQSSKTFIRTSTDGSNWQNSAEFNGIISDGSWNIHTLEDGKVFVNFCGGSYLLSTDNGKTWNQISYPKPPANHSVYMSYIQPGKNGEIFRATQGGLYQNGKSTCLWAVDKSTDGVIWKNIDTFKEKCDDIYNGSLRHVAISPEGDIFLLGLSIDAVDPQKTCWHVRKGLRNSSGEFSWNSVIFNCRGSYPYNWPTRILARDAKTFFIAASGGNETDGGMASFVVKTTDGGTNWKEIDRYQYETPKHSDTQILKLLEYGNGKLLAHYLVRDAVPVSYHAVTRQIDE